jgi:hypothetical protein
VIETKKRIIQNIPEVLFFLVNQRFKQIAGIGPCLLSLGS